MKKLFYLFVAAFVACSLIACNDTENKKEPEPEVKPGDIPGWVMTNWMGAEADGEAFPKAVYLTFEDENFTMYQDVYSYGFVKMTGTYTFAGGEISGTYADGEAWAYTYKVEGAEPTATEGKMTWTAKENNAFVMSFQYGMIPAEVIKSADDANKLQAATEGVEAIRIF